MMENKEIRLMPDEDLNILLNKIKEEKKRRKLLYERMLEKLQKSLQSCKDLEQEIKEAPVPNLNKGVPTPYVMEL